MMCAVISALFPVECSAPGPLITEDIGNLTVALGREATLKCVVTQLSDYKVSPGPGLTSSW